MKKAWLYDISNTNLSKFDSLSDSFGEKGERM